ncbi:hypothetical protein TorRG33x02_086860 [Trema orientale]|uniref:Uncharacterized protein n=1 Tax=Trema orientale TaxID=63057 RepID=A0A2P5FCL6_TREOI|nr:hypothetical protein TorRG33x02_086860 [Trema orientale]
MAHTTSSSGVEEEGHSLHQQEDNGQSVPQQEDNRDDGTINVAVNIPENLPCSSCHIKDSMKVNFNASSAHEKGKGKLHLESCPSILRNPKLSLRSTIETLHVSTSSGCQELTPISNIKTVEKSLVSDSGPSCRLILPPAAKVSPYVEVKPFKPFVGEGCKWEPHYRRRCPFFLPLSDELPLDLERDFSDWINIGLNKRARKNFYPGCDVLDPESDFKINVISSKSWFYKLSQPRQSLSDLHVDVIFYYHQKKALYHPNLYSVKSTTSTRVFDFYLVRAYDGMKSAASSHMYLDWTVEAAMCNYVMGYAYCGRPWADVDLVYMPMLFWDLRKDYHVGDGYAPFKVEWAENMAMELWVYGKWKHENGYETPPERSEDNYGSHMNDEAICH